MTNLTSPAAETAPGFPNTNAMADIIDSLKRLERFGSENSKTTQKLIDAAAELSRLIVGYFGPCEDGTIAAKAEHDYENSKRKYKTAWVHNYSICSGKLCFQGDRGIQLGYEYVAKNRENALRFSKDVAAGLLEGITATLEKRSTETEEALPRFTQTFLKNV
jgi:hypothetical protein